jgi:predicted metalloprotease with PDZ domain
MTTLCRGLARLTVVVAGLLIYSSSFAQRLVYRVDMTHTAEHYVDVTLQPLGLRPDTMTFQMPDWTPGVYSDVHYGRFIRSFEAVDSSGNELPVKRINQDRWKITAYKHPVAQIRYRVNDSHRDGASPMIGLAKIDGEGVFANTEAMFGYIDDDKGIASTIFFTAPKDWLLATTLEASNPDAVTDESRYHQLVYNAEDYETLADAPLAAGPELRTTTFREGGVDFNVIAAGSNDFPIESFSKAADGIIRAESSFYNSIPFDEYTFFVYAGAPESYGIAHNASSVLSFANEVDGNEDVHLLAATFFKTWNGKRFHIPQLGPVDFAAPPATTALWFNEGVSDYYAELLRVRYGLDQPTTFFEAIDGWQRIAMASMNMPIETLSVRTKKYEPGRIQSLRARGALTALLLDIEIRSRTSNHHSLDEVLLRMDHESETGKTYNDKELNATIAKYARADIAEFCNRHVGACDTMPLDEYLGRIGAGSAIPVTMRTSRPSELQLALNAAGMAIIKEVPRDSFYASLSQGDTIAAIDGQKVTAAQMDSVKSKLQRGTPVTLTVVRDQKPIAMQVKATVRNPAPTNQKLSPTQLAMRKAMLGKRKMKKLAYAGDERSR